MPHGHSTTEVPVRRFPPTKTRSSDHDVESERVSEPRSSMPQSSTIKSATSAADRWDQLNSTDADLLDAWVTDQCIESLDTLIRRYAGMVLSVCIRRCHDRADADDAMQTTFLYLAQSAKKIRNPNHLAGWLHRVAQRACIATMMSHERSHNELDDVPAKPADPLERLTLRHQSIVLDEELSDLPTKYRSAIVLHLQQGITIAETAKRLNTSEGSVRGWLARGKQRLAKRLRLRGVAPVAAWAAAQAWSADHASAMEATQRLLSDTSIHRTNPSVESGVSEKHPDSGQQTNACNFSALESLLSQGTFSMPTLTILGTSAVAGVMLLAAFQLPVGEGNAKSERSVLVFDHEEIQPDARLSQLGSVRSSPPSDVSAPPTPPTPPQPPIAKVPTEDPGQDVLSDLAQNLSTLRNEPSSAVAKQVAETLDRSMPFSVNTTVNSLAEALQDQLSVPVLMDEHALTIGKIEPSKVQVSFTSKGEQPIRSSLRRALEPAGLKAIVDDDGLMITADMTTLTRRGVATDRWLDVTPEEEANLEAFLDQKVTYQFITTPLADAIQVITADTEQPILINTVALEEMGLSVDNPVNLSLKDVSLRSMLRLMLRPLDLTYHYKDEVLQITTRDAAESSLRQRLYFLEGTGQPRGGLAETSMLITNSIQPDTWDVLGGSSTITPVSQSRDGRPAILVSTTDQVHEEIEDLMRVLRETHTGDDPRLSDAEFLQEQKQRQLRQSQMFGGGMGGMGGGMGGMF